MSNILPIRIHPLQAAGKGESFEGTILLSRMKRLASELLSDTEAAGCHLMFFIDPAGQHRLKIRIQADLVLRCERCLGRLTKHFDLESDFLLLDEGESLRSEEACEIIRSDPDGLHILGLIEDELMLARPLIPKHFSLEQCGPEISRWLKAGNIKSKHEVTVRNSFEILKTLKIT